MRMMLFFQFEILVFLSRFVNISEFECKNPGFSMDANPSVLENLDYLIQNKSSKKPFHYIPNVTKKIEWVFKVCSIVLHFFMRTIL